MRDADDAGVWSLPYSFYIGDGELEEAIPEPLASEADFDKFVRDRMLLAFHTRDDGSVKRKEISSLRAARSAVTSPRVHLVLYDAGVMLEASVSTRSHASKIAATAFELVSNKAVAIDADLTARFGQLTPVNNGEEVVFVDTSTGNDFMSVDGLFLCKHGVLFNEAKAHLGQKEVAQALKALANLSFVAANPARFKSRPANVVELIAGRSIVPLLSSSACDVATSALAAQARVHVLAQTGEGFACAPAKGGFEPRLH